MRVLIVILIFFSVAARAQYVPILSQYMFNDMALNPANTGNQEALSIFGNYRAQWVGIPGAPTTQTLSVHSPLKSLNSAVGLQFFADQIGVNRNTGIYGSYAYRIRMKTARLSFGLSGGISMLRSRNSQLQVNDQGDGSLTDTPLGILPDFSFGASLNSEKYFVSFSLPMFLGYSFDGAKFKIRHDIHDYNFMLGGGYAFNYSNDKQLKPSLLLKYKVGARPQVDINLMAELHPMIEAGISYRTEEAIIGLIKISPTKQLSIMYSFGMPLTAISYRQYGSHELALRYNFIFKTQISSPRYLAW
ncbi:MAG: type IX secretion system membrane protein PorP/SprF [Crocinitomicaceae bacterium]|nr:type IX secretion system membrane protein PorP/SprF [Crocinitomicaceae bacterium]